MLPVHSMLNSLEFYVSWNPFAAKVSLTNFTYEFRNL